MGGSVEDVALVRITFSLGNDLQTVPHDGGAVTTRDNTDLEKVNAPPDPWSWGMSAHKRSQLSRPYHESLFDDHFARGACVIRGRSDPHTCRNRVKAVAESLSSQRMR